MKDLVKLPLMTMHWNVIKQLPVKDPEGNVNELIRSWSNRRLVGLLRAHRNLQVDHSFR